MSGASRDNVAEVKAAADIVEVVGGYVDLKPAGAGQFKAVCPFHQEKTPSFHVHRDRQIFHCFGCGKGGDVLTFVQEIEGMDFREALEMLAERYGVRLERYSGGKSHTDDRTEMFRVSAFAARFYREQFLDSGVGDAARRHVFGREFAEETVKKFAIGYAPEGWQPLTDAARRQGFKDPILEKAGLTKRGSRGIYDRFRDRVMFPIRDVSDKVVAFGGRTLGDDPAKYLNSAESPIYHKSRVLYGLYEAREAMRARCEALIVEGYFDLLRCFEAGFENTVATCGTSLTPEQARLIRRYVTAVVVVFDGDEAGRRAALRSVGILAGAGLTVRALALPDGLDPDDFIRERGPEAFGTLVSEALGVVPFYVRMNRGRTDTIEGRTAVARELFEVIRGLDDPLQHDEYLKLIALELRLDEYRCRDAYQEFVQGRQNRSISEQIPEKSRNFVNEHDREFVSILLEHPGRLREAWAALDGVPLPDNPVVDVVRSLAEAPEADPLERLEGEAARQLYAAAAAGPRTWDSDERAGELVRERIARFKRDALLQERNRLQDAIRQAQRQHDEDKLTELALRKISVDREIEQVGAA